MKICNCKICDKQPDSFSVNMGRESFGWVVECTDIINDNEFPDCTMIEHRVSVYGKDQQHAEERWNNLHEENTSNIKDFEPCRIGIKYDLGGPPNICGSEHTARNINLE